MITKINHQLHNKMTVIDDLLKTAPTYDTVHPALLSSKASS